MNTAPEKVARAVAADHRRVAAAEQAARTYLTPEQRTAMAWAVRHVQCGHLDPMKNEGAYAWAKIVTERVRGSEAICYEQQGQGALKRHYVVAIGGAFYDAGCGRQAVAGLPTKWAGKARPEELCPFKLATVSRGAMPDGPDDKTPVPYNHWGHLAAQNFRMPERDQLASLTPRASGLSLGFAPMQLEQDGRDR